MSMKNSSDTIGNRTSDLNHSYGWFVELKGLDHSRKMGFIYINYIISSVFDGNKNTINYYSTTGWLT